MKVGIGLSGGVDSGTTALLLKEKGYEVTGFTMWLFDSQTEEISSAKAVAESLGIDHIVLDFRAEFKSEVIEKFVSLYERGYTPNPCLICNKSMKYGRLLEEALAHGMDLFATGHYARRIHDGETGEYKILKAFDQRKDQSYNLFSLTQDQLSRLLFPIGEFNSKQDVRERAKGIGVSMHDKKDSTGICFLGKSTMKAFLKSVNSSVLKPGSFVDSKDNYLGRHTGIFSYTIGQKKGLPEKPGGGYYVVTRIDAEQNKVVLGSEADLVKGCVFIEGMNFLSKKTVLPIKVSAKLSQWAPLCEGTLCFEEGTYVLQFDSGVRAPAIGQGVAVYAGDELLGGGYISGSR